MAEVYAIGFPNGKLYIGITSLTAAKRLSPHVADMLRGSKCAVHQALRKYGRNVKLMALAQGVAPNEAKDLEIWWISQLSTMAPDGYNLTVGGDGAVGYRQTDDARVKMSKAQIGKKHTAETKAKISKTETGKKLTAETKVKMRKAATKRSHRSPARPARCSVWPNHSSFS